MGLEYLRSLAAMLVVINHAWFMGAEAASPIHAFWTAIVYSIVLVGVPVFVMLSGAFLIKNERNTQAWRFWTHSFKKLFPLSFAFFVLAFFWQSSLWSNYIQGQYGTAELLKKIVHWYGGGAALPLWYLCMLPGLYFAVPFMAKLWKTCRLKTFVAISIPLYMGYLIAFYIDFTLPHPFSAALWLGHFMLGCIMLALVEKQRLPSIKACCIAIGITISCSVVCLYYHFLQSPDIYSYLWQIGMPFISLLSILLFALFAQIRTAPKPWVLLISQLSFLIYLTHVPCQRVIRCILFHTGYINELHATALNNALFALSSLVLSITAAYCIHRIYGKLTKQASLLTQKVLPTLHHK